MKKIAANRNYRNFINKFASNTPEGPALPDGESALDSQYAAAATQASQQIANLASTIEQDATAYRMNWQAWKDALGSIYQNVEYIEGLMDSVGGGEA
tara:strand:- start:5336 stop:5626 length:291 start_codon:yes stop_codon:yes gene_type:complete